MSGNGKIPDDMSLGRLVLNIGRLQILRADQQMEHLGLHRAQAWFLLVLSENEGMTHSEIAAKLEISPAAATKVIKRMETLSYVRRCADAKDERISRVFLNPEGWNVIHKIQEIFRQVDQILLQNLSPEDLRGLRRLLQQMHNNLLEPASEST